MMQTSWIKMICRSVVAVAISTILSGVLLGQQLPALPKVNAVEPADWQAGGQQEVELRLSGEHLEGVVGVKVKHKGIRVIHVVPQGDNHLLVTLRISPKAEPGPVMLQVYTRYLTTFAALPMHGEGNSSGVLSATN